MEVFSRLLALFISRVFNSASTVAVVKKEREREREKKNKRINNRIIISNDPVIRF